MPRQSHVVLDGEFSVKEYGVESDDVVGIDDFATCPMAAFLDLMVVMAGEGHTGVEGGSVGVGRGECLRPWFELNLTEFEFGRDVALLTCSSEREIYRL